MKKYSQNNDKKELYKLRTSSVDNCLYKNLKSGRISNIPFSDWFICSLQNDEE